MTRNRSTELFIYDLAARATAATHRPPLVTELPRSQAELIGTAFVPAENEDTHALEFYRAVGGVPSPVTFFTFSR